MKSGSQNWSKKSRAKATELKVQMEALDASALDAAVQEASAGRLGDVVSGIERFARAPRVDMRSMAEAEWELGSSRLLPYGDGQGAAVLCVPSLINRAGIFDLQERHSMVQFLAAEGLNVYLLDWGQPEAVESEFAVADYVMERLLKAVDYLVEQTGQPVRLVGYCMGGIMSIAASQHYGDKIAGLGLVATPWDFRAADVMRLPDDVAYAQFMEGLFSRHQTVSGQLVHQLLYMINPWAVHDKYARFAKMEEGSAMYDSFLAREHWLHDEMAMSPKVARNCFVDWAQENQLAEGKWYVGGEAIDPKLISQPCFVAIAEHDRVVPPACAMPLLAYLRQRVVIEPASGHIGLVAGLNAKERLWIPLANWLKSL